ncbi:MAG: hypothetical protein ACLQBJ_09030 [Bryobacteraceae bacterium]
MERFGGMGRGACRRGLGALLLTAAGLSGQAIEFETGGLHYQTLTRAGVTIMFAELPLQIREYAVLQVAVSNGSPSGRTIKGEDFRFLRRDGTVVRATPAPAVVEEFLEKGNRNDVIKLVSTYELGLYGMGRFRSTNGYEVRRRNAQAELYGQRLKAAAAASAIAFVTTRLRPAESTDGAIFFPTQGKPIGTGKLVINMGLEVFEFDVGGDHHPGQLKTRPPATDTTSH